MPSLVRSPVRAVFFDAGNTLLRMDYSAIAERLAIHGLVVRPEAVERAEWRARVRLDDELLTRRAPGTSTEAGSTATQYVRLILATLGVNDETVVENVAEWRRGYNPPVGLWGRPAPRARAALERAGAAGLRAAVISNSNGSVRAILEGLGLAARLEFVLDSAEVGVEKPDPAIFRLACQRAGIAPGEAVYVGDLYSVDVQGARAVGMEAVLLDPGGCWGARGCATARDVLEAVELIVAAA